MRLRKRIRYAPCHLAVGLNCWCCRPASQAKNVFQPCSVRVAAPLSWALRVFDFRPTAVPSVVWYWLLLLFLYDAYGTRWFFLLSLLGLVPRTSTVGWLRRTQTRTSVGCLPLFQATITTSTIVIIRYNYCYNYDYVLSAAVLRCWSCTNNRSPIGGKQPCPGTNVSSTTARSLVNLFVDH